MSFLAKLFLDDTERQILNADILVRQTTDWIGRPDSMPQGGLINVKVASTHETLFWEWMVSPIMMKNGYIRFYKHDGMSKLFDLEFWDCYCVDYYEFFDDSSNEPLELNLTFSPGVIRLKNTVFEKNWRITDLSQIAGQAVSINEMLAKEEEEEVEKDIVEMYYTDLKGNRITELSEKKVKLIVKTQNMVGETIDLDFDDDDFNYKYKGEILENDLLEGYLINSDTEEIELEVVEEEDYEEEEA